MAAELNDYRCIGGVTSTADLGKTHNGTFVCRWYLRVDTTVGEQIEWVDLFCEWYGKRAKRHENIKLGARIMVGGKLIQRRTVGELYATGLLVTSVVPIGVEERVDSDPAVR